MRTKIPAVAYYRMSSDRQESSIEDQKKSVKRFAKLNGYKIIREYADEGISGWKEKERVEFQQMMSDLSKGDFEAVLCWDQDRFSRSRTLKTSAYFNQLQEAGVTLATVAQGAIDFDSIGGILTSTVTAYAKHEFCKDLARNVARGMNKRRSEGKWLAKAPLGYVLEDGRLTPGDPDEIATVRRIFTQRAKGYGIPTIAKQLNQDGISTPNGTYWRYQTVKQVLAREAYLGHTVSRGKQPGKYATATKPGERIDNTHKPLISQNLWDKAHAVEIRKLQPHDRQGCTSTPLAGLVYCGKCGHKMYQQPLGSGKKIFCCSTAMQGGQCGRHSTPVSPLETIVYNNIRQHVLGGSVEKLTKRIEAHLGKRQPPRIDNSRQIAKLDKHIERASARILTVDDSLVADLEDKLMDMKEQRNRLEAQQQIPVRQQLSAKQIASKAWELDRIMRNAPPQEARTALSKILESVTLQHKQTGGTARRKLFTLTSGEIKLLSGEQSPQVHLGCTRSTPRPILDGDIQ